MLPAFGALEALAILRAAHAHIPLIAMAAVTREEAIVDALRAGAVDYLSKNQLARLPLQLVTVHQNERKRLALGPHDELGQRLTVLNMLLYRLQPPDVDADGPATWQQAEQELTGMDNGR